MIYDCLVLSKRYTLSYLELTEDSPDIPNSFDFYAFNYHHVRMSWLDTTSVRNLPGLKLTFVLETLPNNPFVLCPPDDFNAYCTLDPTMAVSDPRVYAFPRPLEVPSATPVHKEKAVPTIGTFGFATYGKGFELVVEAVNKEFDAAVVRVNIPPSDFAFTPRGRLRKVNYTDYLGQLCKKVAKRGTQVVVTNDYMSKTQLIGWCAENTLNCFLYNRNQPGLSATTDQAIVTGRPLAVSNNETFRHIHQYLTPYPLRSLKESLTASPEEVKRMCADWSPDKFADRFEKVLADNGLFGETAHLSLPPEYVHLARKSSHITPAGRAVRVIRKLGYAVTDVWDSLKPTPRRSTLCKFLLSTSEVRACSSYLRAHGLISHRLICKDWDLANIISDLSDGNLLDMGSSDSYLLMNAIRKGLKGEKFGIDLQRPDAPVEGVSYVLGDLTKTGLPDGKFSNITCLSVIEHDVDFEAFASESSRLLTPGGKLYVTFDYWTSRVAPRLQIFRSPWKILDRSEVERLVSVCRSFELDLVDDIDWSVGRPVINARYYSPDPSTAYTFGMLVFRKKPSP